MYQIFVVEDELLIRQSIRLAIEKTAGPFSLCGEASDGEMALSIMQDLMPDILLTDIRMPFLDGFELIRHVKSMMPWIKIVIISGYGEFEDAQRAISLGADKYLLKPLRPGELADALQAIARQIDEARQQQLPSGYDRDEMNVALQEHFMHQLLGGYMETGALLEKARALKLEIIHPAYQVLLFSFGIEGHESNHLQLAVMRLLDQLKLTLYSFNEYDQLTLLICGSQPEQVSEESYRIITILRHELRAHCASVTTVVSDPVTRLSSVCDAYKSACELYKAVGSLATGQVIDAGDTTQITAELLTVEEPFGGEFRQQLLTALPQDVPALVDECLKRQDSERFCSMLLRYYALIDLLKTLVQMHVRMRPNCDHQEVLSQVSSRYDLLSASSTYAGFVALVKDLLTEAVELRQRSGAAQQCSPAVLRAKKYVDENFCDPGISLMSVARHVDMSPAHFATVFSQAVGTPFIGYLTALRISRAKELLTQTDKKLSSIAMEIGYNEPNYFSYVFRKSEGLTPKEYRSRHE